MYSSAVPNSCEVILERSRVCGALRSASAALAPRLQAACVYVYVCMCAPATPSVSLFEIVIRGTMRDFEGAQPLCLAVAHSPCGLLRWSTSEGAAFSVALFVRQGPVIGYAHLPHRADRRGRPLDTLRSDGRLASGKCASCGRCGQLRALEAVDRATGRTSPWSGVKR